jgi:hypothetical protein
MLGGLIDSLAFVAEYGRLRDEEMGIEQALNFVGDCFRMLPCHLRHLPVGEAKGRAQTERNRMGEPMFPKFVYHLDESDPDIVILRRQDGTLVAAFSARGSHHRRPRRGRQTGLRSLTSGERRRVGPGGRGAPERLTS